MELVDCLSEIGTVQASLQSTAFIVVTLSIVFTSEILEYPTASYTVVSNSTYNRCLFWRACVRACVFLNTGESL